jgi:hypothetical protein
MFTNDWLPLGLMTLILCFPLFNCHKPSISHPPSSPVIPTPSENIIDQLGEQLSITWGEFDQETLNQIIMDLAQIEDPGIRLVAATQYFLSIPYDPNTNTGEPAIIDSSTGEVIKEDSEKLCINFAAMDCITLLEISLALCYSKDYEDFIFNLQQIKYQDGQISYNHRNHYTVDWLYNAQKLGILDNLTADLEYSQTLYRSLSVLENYPIVYRPITFISKWMVPEMEHLMLPGDIIAFVSHRDDLDIGHIALLVPSEEGLILRHASRLSKKVTDNGRVGYYLRISAYLYKGIVWIRPIPKDPYFPIISLKEDD